MNVDIVLVSVNCLFVMGSLLFSYMIWQKANIKIQQLESQLEQQQAEIVRVNKVAIGVGRQVLNLQQESKSVQSPKSVPASKSTSSYHPDDTAQNEYLPYSQAVDLLKQGYSLDEVQEKCRLSKAEAELLALMQNHEKKALSL